MAEFDLNSTQFDEPHPEGGMIIDLNSAQFDAPEQAQAPSFVDRVKADYKNRLNEGQQAVDAYKSGRQSGELTGIQYLGKVGFGTASDIGGEAFKSATDALPQGVKDAASSGLHYLGSTPPGRATVGAAQYLGDQYQDFAKGHPDGARTVEALANIGGVLAPWIPVKGTSVAGAALDAASKPVAKLGGKVVNSIRATRLKSISENILPDISTVRGRGEAIEGGGVGVKKTLLGKGNAYAVASPAQQEAIQHLADIKGYNPKNLYIDNANIVYNEIGKEAQSLKNSLVKENVSLSVPERIEVPETKDSFGVTLKGEPIVHPETNLFHSVLDDEINKLSSIETLSGNARTTATKVAGKMKEFVDKNPPTTAGLLQARIDFDKWVRQSRVGQKAIEPDFENGLSAATRTVRQATNDFIAANTKSANVKASLKKQSALFRAKDALEEKAAKQEFTRGARAKKVVTKALTTKAAATAAISAAGAGAAYLGAKP